MFEGKPAGSWTVDELLAIDLSGLSADELLDHCLLMAQLVDRFEAAKMTAQAAYVEAYSSVISQPASREYALAAHLSEGTAANELYRAESYSELYRPMREAMAAGALSARAARAIEQATSSAAANAAEAVAAILDRAIAYAASHTPSQIRRTVRRWLNVVDPRSAEQRHQDALATRNVEHYVTDDGLGVLSISGNPVETYLVYKAICIAAEHDKSVAEHSDKRTLAQHRADVAIGVLYDAAMPERPATLEQSLQAELTQIERDHARGSILAAPLLACVDAYEVSSWQIHRSRKLQKLIYAMDPDEPLPDEDPPDESPRTRTVRWGPESRGKLRRKGSSPIQINIIMDDATIAGIADNPAVVDGQFSLPASAARRFASQADFRRLLTERDTGELLEASPNTYSPNRALREFVILHDQTCNTPNCDRPADRCELDHRDPFNHNNPTAGGPTTKDNLHALCKPFHQAKTDGAYHVREDDDGLYVLTPLARHYTIDITDLRPSSIAPYGTPRRTRQKR